MSCIRIEHSQAGHFPLFSFYKLSETNWLYLHQAGLKAVLTFSAGEDWLCAGMVTMSTVCNSTTTLFPQLWIVILGRLILQREHTEPSEVSWQVRHNSLIYFHCACLYRNHSCAKWDGPSHTGQMVCSEVRNRTQRFHLHCGMCGCPVVKVYRITGNSYGFFPPLFSSHHTLGASSDTSAVILGKGVSLH